MLSDPGHKLEDIVAGRCRARAEWRTYFARLITAGLVVDHAGGLRWTPIAELLAQVFAKKTHGARRKVLKQIKRTGVKDIKLYLPKMWREARDLGSKSEFREAKDYDLLTPA